MKGESVTPQENDLLTGAVPTPEEVLVQDPRARLTPSQVVERKLVALLQSVPLPMSQVQTGGGPRRPTA